MNPYNQQHPYNYQQHTPGPPQPAWQGPPPRQGWFDPRMQQQQQQAAQPPISPFQSQQFGYPPPPPPPAQSPRPHAGQYDTSSWGVKYNQPASQQQEEHRPQWIQQSEEYRPPLPPRLSSSTVHHGPTPQSEQWHGGPAPDSQPAAGWQDPYQNQSETTSYNIPPPPPPPRPPEYQAQMQAQFQADSLPHQHYSHQPLSHHYDPQAQRPQTPSYPAQHHDMAFASPDRPSHMAYPSTDPALVSPIESETHHWPQQPPSQNLQASKPENHFYSSAIGTGGPSAWEHFNDAQNVSPEMSSPPPSAAILSQPPTMSSPPQMPVAIPQSPPRHHEPPISAATNYGQPPEPPHRGSDTSSVPAQGINRTGTIDSLIQAWNKPLSISAKPMQQIDSRPESRDQVQMQPQERVVEKIVEKVVDPYDDLEPEFKGSLKRYVTMLRKETAADTDEAKLDIFQSFVKKELRLRSMLYGIEVQLQATQLEKKADGVSAQPVQNVPAPQEPVSVAAALTPSTASHTTPIPLPASTSTATDTSLTLNQPRQGFVPVPPVAEPAETPKGKEPQSFHISETLPPPSLKTITPEGANVSPQSRDEPFVVVSANGGDDEAEYSPGGRPRLNRHQDEAEYSPGGRPRINRPQVVTTRPEQSERKTTKSAAPARNNQVSPSANAPMVLEDYAMAAPPSPGANAPMLVEPNSATDLPQVVTESYGPASASNQNQSSKKTTNKTTNSVPTIKFEPPRPAYLPFKYNPTTQAPTQPADQSYSTLRKDAADSGRLLVHEPVSAPESQSGSRASSPGPSRPQDEAFIGLIRSQSKAVRPKKTVTADLSTIPQLRPGTPRASTSIIEPPVATSNGLITVTLGLKSMLPGSVPDSYGLSQHSKATTLKAKVDTFSDNFSFIHETVIAWDRKNREVRKTLDDERNARQADSEAHIDGLFNDNEIGYADIGDLEAEFKLAEADRKYQEDQQELESFTKDVYQPVTERLRKDLSELNAQYTIAVELLDLESESASRCLNSDSGKAEMGYMMNCLLSVSNKLELRHQKFAEAGVERERRRKRLELTVLYTNGDTSGVKKLEQEFAMAEKMQLLHEARARDTRANKLMDTFDRATVRGLGDNQTYIDDLLVRVRQLKEIVLKDPSNVPQNVYEPQGPRDTLSLAQKAVDFLLADSQKLLTISNVADKMLNDADYAVSVAEARVSNADQGTYEKLAQEKDKEDAKIVEDTNTRMYSIGKAPEEAITLIREVVDKVGDDAEHQDRIKKALEAAKQRNATNEAGS